MDLDALEDDAPPGQIGTVVATAGTTGLGAVDQMHEIIPLARRYGARRACRRRLWRLLHAPGASGASRRSTPAPFLAIADADSVVVDPHKHGLQPYGCGSVLFRDPSIGRFYVHDSPYTYFTSNELHLGEISLECSRAGAAAAAALGDAPGLPAGAGRRTRPDPGAKARSRLVLGGAVDAHHRFRLVVQPELDILTFYPVPQGEGGFEPARSRR